MAHRRRPLLIVALAGLVVSGPTAAGEVAVRAKLGYTKVGVEYRDIRLTITRDSTRFTRWLGTAYFARPKVTVGDLDADGEPEVRVDTYTGGAHCCDETRFYRYRPAGRTYAPRFRHWGNVGYRAKNLDGVRHVELSSRDDRFAYVFTAFAGSVGPIQIWHFERGRLLDVTRRFPRLVQSDADELWRTYRELRRDRVDVRGVLAAWQADQLLLGRGTEGWVTLEAIRSRGELGPRADLAGWPQGRSYLMALRAHLRKLGYGE